jgi:hypothetical protein
MSKLPEEAYWHEGVRYEWDMSGLNGRALPEPEMSLEQAKEYIPKLPDGEFFDDPEAGVVVVAYQTKLMGAEYLISQHGLTLGNPEYPEDLRERYYYIQERCERLRELS